MCLSNIVNFTYVMPPLQSDPTVLICIDLVLPMGWVNSLNFF